MAEYCIEQLNTGRAGRSAHALRCRFPGAASAQERRTRDRLAGLHRQLCSRGGGDPRRAERITREQRIACEVYREGNNTSDRHRLWEERTGLKKTAFRDRLREARAIGLFDEYVVQRQTRGKPEERHTQLPQLRGKPTTPP